MFWPLTYLKRNKFIEDSKWNIKASEAINIYGSAIDVLKELKKDNKQFGVSSLDIIHQKAILELEERISVLETKTKYLPYIDLNRK